MKPAFAVIGAGNGGQAMAAHLTLLGYRASLFDIDREKMDMLRRRGHITVTGALTGRASVAELAVSLKEAVAGKDVILAVTTADRHPALARELLPLLDESQMVVLCPGQTGGAIVVGGIFQAGGKNIVVAETQDLIYTCRSSEPGRVNVSAVKKSMDVAACRKEDCAAVIDRLGQAYPQLRQAPGVLHTGFDNMGAILHPAPMLLNAGRVESGGVPVLPGGRHPLRGRPFGADGRGTDRRRPGLWGKGGFPAPMAGKGLRRGGSHPV